MDDGGGVVGALEKVDARLTALLAESRARREAEVRRLDDEAAQAAAEAAALEMATAHG